MKSEEFNSKGFSILKAHEFFTLRSSFFILHSSLFTLHLNNLLHPHIMVFGRNRFAFLKIEAHTYLIYIRVL